ncbi:MAG: hypothetical protein EOO45_01670 [Flavobacterium sp.]|nr:MAG: hypothetical protein EOO45_01670 [Flavobacterium sp.]
MSIKKNTQTIFREYYILDTSFLRYITIKLFGIILLINISFKSIAQTKAKLGSKQQAEYLRKIFKPNDRVMFLGNSITHAGRYHGYIWLYYMTRFPNLRFTILNGGIGGDIIASINNRLEEDILTKNPNIINLTFGMNDSGYFQNMMADPVKVSDKLFYQTDSAFKLVVEKLKNRPEIEKILMSGSPYDLNTKIIKNNVFPTKPGTFERIVMLQKNTAKANNWQYIDIYHPMDDLNKRYQKIDTNFTLSGSGDRIHPESYGHLVWAYLYLGSQGLKGVPVANLTLDAAHKKAVQQVNCFISNIKGSKNEISFDYLAKSLPFPIDEVKHNGDNHDASFALKLVPIMQDLNQEVLKMTNLDEGTYELSIDGKKMGDFKAENLSKGINLASIHNTPQYMQAMEVLKKNEERGSVERETREYALHVYNFARPNGIKQDNISESWEKMRALKKTNGWIDNDLYERGSDPKFQKAQQDKMDKITEDIYTINKPVTRRLKVVKVK